MIERNGTYTVFVRDWWKPATTSGWPQDREPYPNAAKEILETGLHYAAARAMVREYNSTNDPGLMSRKAELDEE